MPKTAQELLDVLEPVSDDPIRILAVLWTWLDQHRLTMAELRRKPPEIRADAIALPVLDRIGPDERARLQAAPIPAAAEMVVQIDKRLAQSPPEGMHVASSVDGAEVLVLFKRGPLVEKLREKGPPSIVEQPSLTVLARHMAVIPRTVDQVTVEAGPKPTASWRAASTRLELGNATESLKVHLDCLGDAGLEPCNDGMPQGWLGDDSFAVGHFDADALAPEAESACLDAAVLAVEEATGDSSILILPELVATETVERAVAAKLSELNDLGRAPALTALGLYHRVPISGSSASAGEHELLGDEPLARRVNEAIMLGPDGRELWRHRKLSAAQALVDSDETKPAPTEDIMLGRKMLLADSPIGWLALLICIDAFAEHLGRRIERSGADVILVPSLSPSVHRHQNALQLLMQKLWGTAFVCNRAPLPPGGGASRWNDRKNRSFWAIARRKIETNVAPDGRTSIVFALPDGVQWMPPDVQA